MIEGIVDIEAENGILDEFSPRKRQKLSNNCSSFSGQRNDYISAGQIELLFPSKQSLRQLVLLNSIALPLNYGDERSLHYRRVLRNELAVGEEGGGEENGDDEEEDCVKFWTKMAYFQKGLVGAITICLERIKTQHEIEEKARFRLCILTLAVLPAFRRRGVATVLMHDAVQNCQRRWPNIKHISLHCQVSNESAIVFYQKFGFEKAELARNYYASWRIAQTDAFRLELEISRFLLSKSGENEKEKAVENDETRHSN